MGSKFLEKLSGMISQATGQNQATQGASAISLRKLLAPRVQSLGREDPLEKQMEPHSSILAWKIPWTEDPERQSMGS